MSGSEVGVPGMGLLVRLAAPADFDEIARLTVAAYTADGQLDGGGQPEGGHLRSVQVDDGGQPDGGQPGDGGRVDGAGQFGDEQLGGGHSYGKVLADVATRAAQGEMLVAVDAATGEVLGAVTFVLPGTPFAEISRAGEAEFRTLAVDPSAQRRGVARALVRACVDRAAVLGASAVVISVRDFAHPARRLYEEFGFVRIPELDWSPLAGVELLGLRLPLPAGK